MKTFQPKTDEELARAGLLEGGEYDYEVVKCEETQSKAGNDMFKVFIRVFDDEGQPSYVTDYILLSGRMEYKFKHFLYSLGMSEAYDSGQIEGAACVGQAGRVKLGIEMSDEFPPKNKVVDYIKDPIEAEGAKITMPKTEEDVPGEEDIPF